jgi:RNA polymerase sigma-54 factor
MGLGLSPQPKPSPQLTISPENLQSLEILELSKPELIQKIYQELDSNPELEIEYESSSDDLDQEVIGQQNVVPLQDPPTEKEYYDDEDKAPKLDFSKNSDQNTTEPWNHPPSETLADSLLHQLGECRLTPEEVMIGNSIIDSLEDDGFLKRSIEDIAESCGCSERNEIAEKVLALLQSFDPPGVCARDLKECLLIQARLGRHDTPLLTSIVMNHLEDLRRKDYKTISRALNNSIDEVARTAKTISQFSPRPGGNYYTQSEAKVAPDLTVQKYKNQFDIILNDDGVPKIKVSQDFKAYEKNGNKLSAEGKEFISNKRKSAKFWVKCIYKREKTLRRVMESILKFQHNFFVQGTMGLKPLQMQTIADDIEMSKSTVERATKNKYVSTPMGIFSLRHFFSESIEQTEGQAVSVTVIQNLIQKIISEENKAKPLSDAKIEERLKSQGYDVQRRTIAKYREKIGILPASLRKKI